METFVIVILMQTVLGDLYWGLGRLVQVLWLAIWAHRRRFLVARVWRQQRPFRYFQFLGSDKGI